MVGWVGGENEGGEHERASVGGKEEEAASMRMNDGGQRRQS